MEVAWAEAELLDVVVGQELAQVVVGFAVAIEVCDRHRVVGDGPEELLQQRQLFFVHGLRSWIGQGMAQAC